MTIRLHRLHLTLQAACGWTNTHLYAFTAGGIEWGASPIRTSPRATNQVDARKARLYDIIRDTGAKTIRYLYDFGDDWQHVIKLERWFENTDTAGMPSYWRGVRDGITPARSWRFSPSLRSANSARARRG